jgi:transposase
LNRLQLVQETMRHVLDVLALVAPTWLRDQCDAAWQRRYASEFVQRLPTTDAGKEQLAAAIGQDGFRLLAAIDAPESPAMLRTLEAVSTVRTIWAQQYAQGDDGPHLRPSEQLAPAAELLASPYDLDARFSIRREEAWIGFLAHLTETCDPELPALVVQVTTTPATTADKTMLPGIQDDLATRELLPSIQLADMGYLEADLLTSSQERHGITLVGPMQPDSSWQARAAAGYALTDFSLDWEEQHATCPQGKTSSTWRAVLDHRKQEVIQIHFRRRDCRDCPAKARCTTADRRSLSVHPQAIHEARLQAQAAEATPAFRRLYQRRAGIEGTISTAIRQMDLRHARMRSFAKVQLEHLLLAASLNLARLAAWFLGRDPVRTRTRPFARLVTVPCSP